MYYLTLVTIHSVLRWIFLAFLLYSLVKASIGLIKRRRFTKVDNIIRSTVSALSHTQLLVGFMLYFKSPFALHFLKNTSEAMHMKDSLFFGLIHSVAMLISVVLITIGASKAKHEVDDIQKHRVILFWFGISLVIILLAIPWPFGPYVRRAFI